MLMVGQVGRWAGLAKGTESHTVFKHQLCTWHSVGLGKGQTLVLFPLRTLQNAFSTHVEAAVSTWRRDTKSGWG